MAVKSFAALAGNIRAEQACSCFRAPDSDEACSTSRRALLFLGFGDSGAKTAFCLAGHGLRDVPGHSLRLPRRQAAGWECTMSLRALRTLVAITRHDTLARQRTRSALSLHGSAAIVPLLFEALPTASSSYIMARQLGGDAPIMAAPSGLAG